MLAKDIIIILIAKRKVSVTFPNAPLKKTVKVLPPFVGRNYFAFEKLINYTQKF